MCHRTKSSSMKRTCDAKPAEARSIATAALVCIRTLNK